MGTGEFLMIASRVSKIFLPVDKSITVSAPHLTAQSNLSNSSSMFDLTGELPIFALTLVRKLLPIIIGSSSGCLIFDGMIALPDSISFLTNSGVISVSLFELKAFSLCATNSISLVMIPFFA